VLLRELTVRIAYGDELRFEADVPRMSFGGDRRVRVVAGTMLVATGATEVARASSANAVVALRGGRVQVEDAVVRGASVRWERVAGQALGDAPPWHVAQTLQRMARIARDTLRGEPAAADGAGEPAAQAGAPAAESCAVPVEGTVRFEEADLLISEPRLGPTPLHSAAVSGSALLERCGGRVRLDASADGGPASGGWSGWAERTALGTSGGIEIAPAAFDGVMHRLWPGRDLPPPPAESVQFELAHRPGEDSIRVAGWMPVPALTLAAAGHRLEAGAQRAPFELRLGPLEQGRVGLAGEVRLTQAAYVGPLDAVTIDDAILRLDPQTRLSTGLDGTHVVFALEGVPFRKVRLLADPPLSLGRPEVRADLTFRRLGGRRIGVEGSFQAAGFTQPADDGRVELPVLFAGALDEGSWIELSARKAAVRGRFLADGLRVNRKGLPLVGLGPPGVELSLDVGPGPVAGQWVAEGSIGVRGLTLDSPKLAREPLSGISFDLSGLFTVDVPQRTAALDQGRAKLGGVEMALNAAFALHEGVPAIRVAFAGSRTRCQDVIDALPAPLRADLPGLEFDGSVDFSVAFDVDFRNLAETIFELDATSRCRVVAADGSIQMERLRGTFRHEIVLPDGRTETVVTGPGSPDWVPLSQISPYMVAAVITTEDARFFRHSGVSISDLRQAIVRDLRAGRFAYGGSTIDMQVVKNVFLDREKTVARKLQELILTWWMDQALTKSQIMELYLNVIEYGPRIYGIGPAARAMFGRTPADLSPLEAIYLAKCLPDPLSRYRMYQNDSVPAGWRARLDRLLGLMYSKGDLDEYEFQAAVHDQLDFWHPGEPLPAPRYGGQPPTSVIEPDFPPDDEPSIAEQIYGEDAVGGYPGAPDL
jgi:hypothetical protein